MAEKLFTPGPVITTDTVKQAMLHDVSSRDSKKFSAKMKFVRNTLVDLADPDKTGKYTTVLIPGTGSYSLESVIRTVIGQSQKKFLILSNGAFGDRMLEIANRAEYDYTHLRFDANNFLPLEEIENHLIEHGSKYSLIGFVHSESSTGVINPISEVAKLAKRYSSAYLFLDAMSSFGVYPINMDSNKIDFVVSSCNKCLQSVPGMSFVICKTESIEACKGNSDSFCFDLLEQWEGQETKGQFRTTAPTHVFLALEQALIELLAEGGSTGRKKRYMDNSFCLKLGMKKLGFKPVLDEKIHTSCILTNFEYLKDPKFDIQIFFQKLADRGLIFNPLKLIDTDSFRIGTIGHLFKEDIEDFLKHVETVLLEMGIKHVNHVNGF